MTIFQEDRKKIFTGELNEVRAEIAACSSEAALLKSRRTEMCIVNQNEIAQYEILKSRLKELSEREKRIEADLKKLSD